MNAPRRSVLVIAALAALAGCDYFKPADPELPRRVDITGDYTTPTATLQTIAAAVQAKGQPGAAQAYSGAFADSTAYPISGYHQVFWPEDVVRWASQGRSVPADWNLRLETVFYDQGPRSLVQLSPNKYLLYWEPEDNNPDRTGVNPTLLHRRYTFLSVDANDVPVEVIARGFADLTLEQAPNGNWYIVRWEDREDPVPFDPSLTQVTWGQRRLEYQ